MAKIAIITDSTAYLKKEYVEKHNIRVVPLNLHWDGDTFKDGVDISPDVFYDRLKAS
ncbi:MAG: DegV family protein, partial [Anaerolineaceae bacterium]|nr:DegV family protein [Anaerolineaceae bacterium]